MKYLFLFILICNMSLLAGQTNPREEYQNKLEQLTKELKEATSADYVQGPMFNFVEPYEAVFKKESEFSKGVYPNTTKTIFKEGDAVLVIGAAPVGSTLSFKSPDSDEIFKTKAFGRPGFEVTKTDEFNAQVKNIKESEWQLAEVLATMLDCGSLESAGMKNFEKHHLNIGDTPVFIDVKKEGEKVLVCFTLKTYSGNDFKDVGEAVAGKSKLGLTFENGKEVTIDCEEDGSRFGVFDMTEYGEDALGGINKISLTFSKKSVTKELVDEDRHVIGIKMECMK